MVRKPIQIKNGTLTFRGSQKEVLNRVGSILHHAYFNDFTVGSFELCGTVSVNVNTCLKRRKEKSFFALVKDITPYFDAFVEAEKEHPIRPFNMHLSYDPYRNNRYREFLSEVKGLNWLCVSIEGYGTKGSSDVLDIYCPCYYLTGEHNSLKLPVEERIRIVGWERLIFNEIKNCWKNSALKK